VAQAGSRRPWRWLKDPLINDCLRQADAAVMVAGKDREHFLANRSFGEMVEKAPCGRPGGSHRVEFTVRNGIWCVEGTCDDCSRLNSCIAGQATELAAKTRAEGRQCQARLQVAGATGAPRTYLLRGRATATSGEDLAVVFVEKTQVPAHSTTYLSGVAAVSTSRPASDVDLATLRAVLDGVEEGIIVADHAGSFRYFNGRARDILGLGARAIPADRWSEIYGVFEPDRKTLREPEELPLARSLRGETVTNDFMFIRNPGNPDGVWIKANSWPIQADGEAPSGIVVFSDITASRERDQRLDRMDSAVRQTADAVMITNAAGRIEYVNPAFERLTGYEMTEVEGETPRLLKSGKHSAEFYREMWRTLMQGGPFSGTLINRTKSGTLFWSDTTITPMLNESSEVTNYVAVMRDATDQRRVEDLDRQMTLAAEVQERFYQKKLRLDGFDVAGTTLPTSMTAGDYYDLIELSDTSSILLIADVSGHGLGAALVMAEARSFTRGFAMASPKIDLGELLTRLNLRLVRDLPANQYLTLLAVHLDTESEEMCFCGAGHLPGHVLRADETIEEFSSCGPPLGLFEKLEYETQCMPALRPDDVLLMLTDGVVESGLPHGHDFGIRRSLECIGASRGATAEEMIENLLRASQQYQGVVPRHDDMSAVVCRRHGPRQRQA
jgi:PAS domain S-box-containing protein